MAAKKKAQPKAKKKAAPKPVKLTAPPEEDFPAPQPMTLPRPQKRMGRPTVWTPHVRETFLRAIKLGATMKDAAALSGISHEAWHNLHSGRTLDQELIDFSEQVDQERARVKVTAVGKVLATRQWKAQAWWLSVTDPKQYGPQVRVTLEKEFGGAITRLEQDFGDRPELLAKILDTLSRSESDGSEGPVGASEAELEPGPADPDPGSR